MTKEFKVAAVSTSTNSFGLTGIVLVALDGDAYQAGRNITYSPCKEGDVISLEEDDLGYLNWAEKGFEIPEKLPQRAPQVVIDELWRKEGEMEQEAKDPPTDDPLPDDVIYVVTADYLHDTGLVSFRYVFDSKMPKDMQRDICTVNLPFGCVFEHREGDGVSFSFNVFTPGKGLLCGGGWTPSDTEEWQKKMLDAIPSCSMLMTTKVFDWFSKEVLDKFGRKYVRHHSTEPLLTS